jgi:hypothetical protein
MEEIHGLFGGPVGFLIGMIAVGVAGRWVFGPLNRAAEERDCRIQFTIADVLCLFVATHFALSMLLWEAREKGEQRSNLWVVGVLITSLAALGWWQFVRTLSRAGVRVVWQRCVLMIVVLPITAIGSFAVAFVPFAVIDLFASKPNILRDVCILVAGISLPGVIYRLGDFTRAIVEPVEKG